MLMVSISKVLNSLYFFVLLYFYGMKEMLTQFVMQRTLQHLINNPPKTLNSEQYKNKTVIITGGTHGIGLSLTETLSKHGLVVIAAGPTHFNDVVKYGKKNIHYLYLDLSSFESIEVFVNSFNHKFDDWDYLVNNAGVMLPPYQQTKLGHEFTYGVNFIGHAYLTQLLLQCKKSSSIPRIINVCSSVMRCGTVSQLLEPHTGVEEASEYSSHRSYILSKLAIALYTKMLVKKKMESGVKIEAFSVHPGVVNTDLYRHVWLPLQLIKMLIFGPLLFRSANQSANVIIHTMLECHSEKFNGAYIEDFQYDNHDHVPVDQLEMFWKRTCSQIRQSC